MYQRTILESGLTVLTETVPSTRSTAIGILVDASPHDDPQGKSGLAHLAEHAFFLGTGQRDSTDIARFIDSAGGQIGAFTSRDYTCFFANVLDEYCTYAMDVLGDILCSSTFPEEKLEREKQSICREIEMGDDDPSEQANTTLKEAIWRGHTLANSIDGDAKSVLSLTREDVRRFISERYQAPQITVVAAGNVQHDAFVGQAQDAFWRLGTKPHERKLTPCVFEPAVVCRQSPVSQTYFSLAIPVSSYASESRYADHVLNTLFGGGMSSRLFTRLREQQGAVYRVQSMIQAYRDAGILCIEGACAPEHIHYVLAQILIELIQLATWERPVDEDELWRAKMQTRGQHSLAAESMNTRMSRLATQEFYFSRQIQEEEILAEIDGLDCDRMKSCAAALASGIRQVSVACLGPCSSDTYNENSLSETLADFRELEVGA